ncbi:hypothetical protein Pmar_PMAR019862 [Perkinsus marinus ATCC 50983]|uniref:Uncharacterized protein n=1 Tax=Perkinsus marinus (strain ATCC 50983 / TXsc) TaxID=423536 RepID=C5KBU9_PERM5|nr:hypothetical protein Pmar_PMAR019862 [Perkinsus marinus ATCC 50983]EER17980.1 hypothetical protein Pmar_PMAR019862 [Perkinsus marinus ATCC 50983]|eukprot:XP_002786184.1 hypothetical protein Pmar_PMAR019862 [Perkinsus marinus ATCC 50983]
MGIEALLSVSLTMPFRRLISRRSTFLTGRVSPFHFYRRFCSVAAVAQEASESQAAPASAVKAPRLPTDADTIQYAKLKMKQMQEAGNTKYIPSSFPADPTDADYLSWYKSFKKIKSAEKKRRATRLLRLSRSIFRQLATKALDVDAISEKCPELGELLKNPPSIAGDKDTSSARHWASQIEKLLAEKASLLEELEFSLSPKGSRELISLKSVSSFKSLITCGAFDNVEKTPVVTEGDRIVHTLVPELKADESRYFSITLNEADSLESWLVKHGAENVPSKKFSVSSSVRNSISNGLKNGLLESPKPSIMRLAHFAIEDADTSESLAVLVSELKQSPERLDQLTPAEVVLLKRRIAINRIKRVDNVKDARSSKGVSKKKAKKSYGAIIKYGFLDRPREDLIKDKNLLETPETVAKVEKVVEELKVDPERYKTLTPEETKLLTDRIEVNKNTSGVVKRIRDYLTTIRGQESTASLSDAQLLDMRAEFEATEQYRNRIKEIKLQQSQAKRQTRVDNLTQKAMTVAKQMFSRGRLDFDPSSKSEDEVLQWYRDSVAAKIAKKKEEAAAYRAKKQVYFWEKARTETAAAGLNCA